MRVFKLNTILNIGFQCERARQGSKVTKAGSVLFNGEKRLLISLAVGFQDSKCLDYTHDRRFR